MSIDLYKAESAPGAYRGRTNIRERDGAPSIIALRRTDAAVPERVGAAALVKALDMSPSAVFFLTPGLQIVDANAAATEATGLGRRELLGVRLDKVIADGGDGRWLAGVKSLLRGAGPVGMLPARQRRNNGDWSSARVQLEYVDHGGEPLLIAVVHDAAAREIEERESRDYLTALPTRGALESRLRRARGSDSRFAVLFIDVDRFKSVNDTYGHRTGDAALGALGRRLAASVRPGDFVARYGGDEFVALVEDVRTDAEVQPIVARIHDHLSEPIGALDSLLQLSVSIGVAMGGAGTTPDALLDESDRAMYRMKQLKRSNCLDTNLS